MDENDRDTTNPTARNAHQSGQVRPKTSDTFASTKSGKSVLGIFRKDTVSSEQKDKDPPKGTYGLTTLYDPEVVVPRADIVFVHGLNGGSQSTWTKGDDTNFWPKFWLPSDDGFADVRIHSFGYHSGISKQSILHIQDFARNLLSAIHDAPSIVPKQNVPLILVGHSMGGLVIKMAYVLGHSDPEFKDTIANVFAMFFLGVPHHGASIAQTLSRLLSFHGARPFVNELFPSSNTLSLLNEEFPRLSKQLRLFSFFETRPMLGNSLIVDREAAVLGYTNERRVYLDANHRDVARFSSPEDPSFLMIRNAMATLINDSREADSGMNSPNDANMPCMEIVDPRLKGDLNRFLGAPKIPEDDLTRFQSLRLRGSCEWLLQRHTYIDWKSTRISANTFWLRGRPGAGKSVISGAVISDLHENGKDCCYFFFGKGDKSKITIKSFLRSMALQMATIHPGIARMITGIAAKSDESTLEKNDAGVIWRKLFLNGILKYKLRRPQYWVIDALDESNADAELIAFLTKAQEYWPLYIFATSRNSIDSASGLLTRMMDVVSETVTEEDNYKDIELLLEHRQHRFPAPTPELRALMARRVLVKSQGCFLWAQLVVQGLLEVGTTAQAEHVIDNNSSDMDTLYLSILDRMSTSMNRDSINAIFTWATCCSRPLFLEELQAAIKVHIKADIGDMKRFISDFCGNLVFIDRLGRLQLIHLTARELLTRDSLDSVYRVKKGDGHRTLALVCIEYLVGEDTGKTSRTSKVQIRDDILQTPFANYAMDNLFHHLSQCGSYDDRLILALARFLGSPKVLSWIEHVARRTELDKIFAAGKILGHVVRLRARNTPPIGLQRERETMDRWSSDLQRIATKFGRRLTTTPYSIHHLVPPMCPPSSAIYQQFSSVRGLSVSGTSNKTWDDCLSTMSFTRPSRPNIIATTSGAVAIGTSNGVILYDDTTFQEVAGIRCGEPIWAAAFSDDGTMVAMAGPKRVHIWDNEKNLQVQVIPTKTMCLDLAFGEEGSTLWIALRNNQLLCWEIDEERLRPGYPINWTDDLEWKPELSANSPSRAVFCMHMNLLAIVYRGEDLVLWHLEEELVFDFYAKDCDMGRSVQRFSGTTLLAVAYHDGDLVVFDTETGTVIDTQPAFPQTLRSSPDGRTLASGDSQGSISLYDFPTLKFLYKIQFEADALKIRALAFTLDNLRLIEVRGSQCRVWEPSILLREDADDGGSDISMTTAPLEIEYQATKALDITAMAIVHSAPLVFCGKEDGTVHIYDISFTPKQQELFVQTRSCPIILLHYDFTSNLLTCCDAATRVTTRKVSRGPRNTWAVSEGMLETRPGTKVEQIACSGKHGRVLVSTDDHNTLWAIGEGGQEISPPSEYVKRIDGSTRPSWVQHANSDTLIRVMDFGANIYSWSDLRLIRTVSFTALDPPMTDSIIQLQHNRFFATISKDESSNDGGRSSNQRSGIHVWDMAVFEAPHATTSPEQSNGSINSTTTTGKVKPAIDLGTLSTVVEQAIGVTNGRFVFLDRDYWVCSIDLTLAPVTWNKDFTTSGSSPNLERRFSDSGLRQTTLSIGPGNVVRHFFVPYEWISMVTKVQAGMGSRREIIFVNRSELAIVKKGLDVCEQGFFKPSRAAEGASVAAAGGSSGNGGLLPVRPGGATMSGGIWNRERYSV
ncbi:GPI inositol-deacylase [Apiospora marii]|uniref:GPI inositol-deacylase n=1 Tax=Apiospora marii TaxID=335849 RepID=UPI00312DE6CE